MHQGRRLFGIALAVVALAAAGCSGTVRMASTKSCKAHGGTYDASAHTCTFERSSKHAAAICQEEGGYYDPNADYCELGRD